jgi:hypothetical protein
MTDLAKLSDTELLENTKLHARQERESMRLVIEHLEEVERRRLYAVLGFSSLWEYATKDLGYSAGAAQRRIAAMRLGRELPEIKPALENAEVALESAAMLHQFFKAEKKEQGKTYSIMEKRELFEKVLGLSTRDTIQVLRELSPLAIPAEKERPIAPNQTQVQFVASDRVLEMLDRMKELLSGRDPNPSNAKVIEKALELALQKLEPRTVKSTSAAEVKHPKQPDPAKYRIPKSFKLLMRAENDDRCTFVSGITGRRCGSRRMLETEHRIPWAKNGSSHPANLTLLCRTHNLLRARQEFGPQHRRPALSA